MVFVKIYDAWQVLKRVIPYLIMIPFIIDDVVTYFVILTGKKTRTYYTLVIGHFGKYHNTLCLSPQILHKHCFQFLLGLTMVARENKNKAYAKF